MTALTPQRNAWPSSWSLPPPARSITEPQFTRRAEELKACRAPPITRARAHRRRLDLDGGQRGEGRRRGCPIDGRVVSEDAARRVRDEAVTRDRFFQVSVLDRVAPPRAMSTVDGDGFTRSRSACSSLLVGSPGVVSASDCSSATQRSGSVASALDRRPTERVGSRSCRPTSGLSAFPDPHPGRRTQHGRSVRPAARYRPRPGARLARPSPSWGTV